MTKFKVGDRVKNISHSSCIPFGYLGTVKYDGSDPTLTNGIGVEWDKEIKGGHDGNGYGMVGKIGHCWYVFRSSLELVKDIQLEFEF